jgi:hypothetical protein
MKTSMQTLTIIFAVVITLNSNAQNGPRDSRGQNSNQNSNQQQGSSSNEKHRHHSGGNGWNSWGGGMSVNIGNSGGCNNYGNYGNYGYGYNNYYSVKKAARQSLRNSAQVIGNALQFSDWNDTYSPWLAKAIRHQQYAKQLYFWGDYAGALNHAERAGFLAWNTLNYFNSYGNDYDGYGNNSYQDPYQDPNNPYYRKGNTNTTNGNTNNNNDDDSDFGYKKGEVKNQNTTDEPTEEKNVEGNSKQRQQMQKTEVDSKLPENKLSDKELLKVNVKDLDVE